MTSTDDQQTDEEYEDEMLIDFSLLPGGVKLDLDIRPSPNSESLNFTDDSSSLPKTQKLLLDFYKPTTAAYSDVVHIGMPIEFIMPIDEDKMLMDQNSDSLDNTNDFNTPQGLLKKIRKQMDDFSKLVKLTQEEAEYINSTDVIDSED